MSHGRPIGKNLICDPRARARPVLAQSSSMSKNPRVRPTFRSLEGVDGVEGVDVFEGVEGFG